MNECYATFVFTRFDSWAFNTALETLLWKHLSSLTEGMWKMANDTKPDWMQAQMQIWVNFTINTLLETWCGWLVYDAFLLPTKVEQIRLKQRIPFGCCGSTYVAPYPATAGSVWQALFASSLSNISPECGQTNSSTEEKNRGTKHCAAVGRHK